MRICSIWLLWVVLFISSSLPGISKEAHDSLLVEFPEYTISTIPYELELYVYEIDFTGMIYFQINDQKDSVSLIGGNWTYMARENTELQVIILLGRLNFGLEH